MAQFRKGPGLMRRGSLCEIDGMLTDKFTECNHQQQARGR